MNFIRPKRIHRLSEETYRNPLFFLCIVKMSDRFKNRWQECFRRVNLANCSNGTSRALIIPESGIVELECDRYNQRAAD